MRPKEFFSRKRIRRISFILLLFCTCLFIFHHHQDYDRNDDDLQVSLDEKNWDDHFCNFFYILAGNHATYTLNHVNSWMKSTSCSIQMVRPSSDLLLSSINEKEKEILNLLKKYHPVIMADYLKLLILYYSPSNHSVVVDFDVKLLKRFPSQWFLQGLDGCSVFWSIENDCYDSTCAAQYDGRTAQLTTWIEISLQKKSIILRDLIDFVTGRLIKLAESSPNELSKLRVQEFSGSGPLTKWIRNELNLDYTSLPLSPILRSTLKEKPGSILHIPYKDEVICIGGEATAGNDCAYESPTPSSCLVKHYFEGSWKNRKSLNRKMMGWFGKIFGY